MEYLHFIEEHTGDKGTLSLFEKVMVASARAKDLHEERKPVLKSLEAHKPVPAAIYELNHKLITPIIQQKTEDEMFYNEDLA